MTMRRKISKFFHHDRSVDREPIKPLTAQELFSCPGDTEEAIEARGLMPVEVDYDTPLAELIEQGGYDRASTSGLTEENFPSKHNGKALIGLTVVTLRRWEGASPMELHPPAKPVEVVRDIHAQGYVQADLRALLAFGARYPEWQREMTIAAVGDNSWECDPTVPPRGISGHIPPIRARIPILSGDNDSRELYWLHDDDGYYQEVRFLAYEASPGSLFGGAFREMFGDGEVSPELLAEAADTIDDERMRNRTKRLLDEKLSD